MFLFAYYYILHVNMIHKLISTMHFSNFLRCWTPGWCRWNDGQLFWPSGFCVSGLATQLQRVWCVDSTYFQSEIFVHRFSLMVNAFEGFCNLWTWRICVELLFSAMVTSFHAHRSFWKLPVSHASVFWVYLPPRICWNKRRYPWEKSPFGGSLCGVWLVPIPLSDPCIVYRLSYDILCLHLL